MKSQFYVKVTEYHAPIEFVQDIIYCRYGMALLTMAWLALLISMQSLMSPEGLEAMRTGLTQGVGPSTGSIMSWFTSSSCFCSIFSLKPNGGDLNFWAMGGTDSSTWSLA